MSLTAPLQRLRPAQLLILALAPLALLLWLGWTLTHSSEVDPADVTARPALWQATKGDARLWLFGTIHVVPKGEPWLSPAIAQAAQASDGLYLEVTGLDAERQSRTVFEKLGRGQNLPPIAERLSADHTAAYREFQRDYGKAAGNLDIYESWAAALLVSATSTSGLALSAGDAGEAVFTRTFTQAGKPILGLETIDSQLGLFDNLPEDAQRQLLAQSLVEAKDAPALYRAMHDAWARGDLARLEQQYLASLNHSPALRLALVDQRNDRWATQLEAQLSDQRATYLVAVGVGHLIGERSLQAGLQARGWQITRVQ